MTTKPTSSMNRNAVTSKASVCEKRNFGLGCPENPQASCLRYAASASTAPVRLAAFAAGVILIALVLSGCASTGSGSFASVEIKDRSAAQIQQTTIFVFQQNGYRAVRPTDNADMMFEKEGSQGNQVAYAGVVGSHYGETVTIRVRVQLVDLVGGSHRLQCRTYMVRSTGDKFYDDETPLSNLRGGPYQDILDDVAKRLK